MLLLLDMIPWTTEPPPTLSREEHMGSGLGALRRLLRDQCEDERSYQELLEAHPWMFGAQYSAVERHTTLDDRRIPDFTGVRSYDGFRDILEIKQPFLIFC